LYRSQPDEVHREVISDEAFIEQLKARGLPEAVLVTPLRFYQAARAGEFSNVDSTLERLLGRKPQTIKDVWVGLNYAIPLIKAGNLPNAPTPIALEPSTRLDLQVGFVFRTGNDEDWDLFAYYAWLDRGEGSRPETRLPILDGGFDQQQLVLGVGHRFVPKPPADEHGF
jgi:hypothetical protein